MSTLPNYAESIKMMLDKKTHPDLAALYHKGMEVQVNVGRDGGNRVEGIKTKVWTDGMTKWHAIRIPKNAASIPEDNSGLPMAYDIFQHAEAIGITGWNWEKQQSERFGYDFDAIVGHSEKHKKKLSDSELAEVRKQAMSIPFVQTRKSTSGSGLHLWVVLEEPIPTKNHTEHAALGRAILGLMSAIAGFDFTSKVDACGGNMWIWARKMRGPDGEIRGLQIVKEAERKLQIDEVPSNWRSQVKVVSGNRHKTLPEFVEDQKSDKDDIDRIFDELSGQHPRVKLDDEHKRHIKWLQDHNGFGWYDPDHHMLVTHTHHLKAMHLDLNLKGIFETTSPGTEKEEQNCFCFPLRNGAWSVRRYSPGVAEHKTWDQDGVGYTKCYFNKDPNLSTAAKSKGGVEDDKGAFRFAAADMAADVAKALGASFELPIHMGTRLAKLKSHQDGNRLVLEVEKRSDDDPKKMEDWFQEKTSWRRVLNVNKVATNETEVGLFDEVVRHVVTESRMDAGWYVRCGATWNCEPLAHVGRALLSLGRKKQEVDAILGASVFKPWILVNRPFEEEYPGDRLWNRESVQFKYPRVDPSEIGEFPTWQKVLDHCGRGLDDAVKQNGWAIANDVKTGGAYLRYWLASMLQDPFRPLPYLFFFSKAQNTGKSTFHEMVKQLVTGGIVDAGDAIKNKGNFNGELEGAILCFIEEINLRKDKDAYTKIKHWVTSPEINIHKKGLTPYGQPNATHWVHCANDHEACPIFPGDTRITMIEVPPLREAEMIPKDELKELLRKEAPHFLNFLLAEEIPPSGDRLGLPVISTSERESLAHANQNSLETFLDERCQNVPGSVILYSEFWDQFYNSLDPFEQTKWSKKRLTSQLPPCYPTGKLSSSPHIHIGNMAWIDPNNPPTPSQKLARRGDVLRVASESK
jgi:hypothetical protein